MENGSGDKDGGWRTATVTRMENGDGDGDGGRRRETKMEDGNVYVALGAHRVKPCSTTI